METVLKYSSIMCSQKCHIKTRIEELPQKNSFWNKIFLKKVKQINWNREKRKPKKLKSIDVLDLFYF